MEANIRLAIFKMWCATQNPGMWKVAKYAFRLRLMNKGELESEYTTVADAFTKRSRQ